MIYLLNIYVKRSVSSTISFHNEDVTVKMFETMFLTNRTFTNSNETLILDYHQRCLMLHKSHP